MAAVEVEAVAEEDLVHHSQLRRVDASDLSPEVKAVIQFFHNLLCWLRLNQNNNSKINNIEEEGLCYGFMT
jgi:hypothetical protein